MPYQTSNSKVFSVIVHKHDIMPTWCELGTTSDRIVDPKREIS